MKDLRGFLGLTGYYHRFIKNYGLIAQPLTFLLKKNAFEWIEATKQAWDELKQKVVTSLMLALPNFSEVFVVESDASNGGLGVVLSQNGRPIAFFNKTLSPKNQALFVYEKKILAILTAVKKWTFYLTG